uniref:Uncharacterized protein n=1 Tax=Arundo donax TaxID=35708 RepID=A0A0A8YFP5_ARUDO
MDSSPGLKHEISNACWLTSTWTGVTMLGVGTPCPRPDTLDNICVTFCKA